MEGALVPQMLGWSTELCCYFKSGRRARLAWLPYPPAKSKAQNLAAAQDGGVTWFPERYGAP